MISPTVALGEVTKVAAAMAVVAKENVALSYEQFKGYDAKRAEAIAEKWCDRLSTDYPDTQNAYICRLHLYYKQGRRVEFKETMEALKQSDVVVDAQLLEWIRVFG